MAQTIDIVNNDKDVNVDNDEGGEDIGRNIGETEKSPHSSLSTFYFEEKAKSLSLFPKRTQVGLWAKFWHLLGHANSFREWQGNVLLFFLAPLSSWYPQGDSVSSCVFISVKKDLGLEISWGKKKEKENLRLLSNDYYVAALLCPPSGQARPQ